MPVAVQLPDRRRDDRPGRRRRPAARHLAVPGRRRGRRPARSSGSSRPTSTPTSSPATSRSPPPPAPSSATARRPRPSSPSSPLADGQRLSLGEVGARGPGHARPHPGVDLRRDPRAARRRAVGGPDRRHAVHRRRRPPRPPVVGRLIGRRPRPVALPLAAPAAAHPARRRAGLPGPRRRVGLREEPLDRRPVDDRRAAGHQLRRPADGRGRLRGRGDDRPVGGAAVLRLRRPHQPFRPRTPRRRRGSADPERRRGGALAGQRRAC